MRGIFINSYGRLRSGWRIAMVIVIFIISANILSFIPIMVYTLNMLLHNPSNDIVDSTTFTSHLMENESIQFALHMLSTICMIGPPPCALNSPR
jgi:competence protein ComGC